MAIRIIKTDGEDVLRKKSKNVQEINDKIITLLDDMKDTLHKSKGIGLAAPQIGILKRIFIIEVDKVLTEFINPVILKEKDSQEAVEGCLSIPGIWGIVKRPKYIKIEALNRKGEIFVMEAEDVMARVVSHENDHLDGTLFKDKVIRFVREEDLE